MKTKMIISDFRKSFSILFFRFLVLNENGSDNKKIKMKMIKLIGNESENDFALFRPFSKITVFSR
jgi:hypothetical protein